MSVFRHAAVAVSLTALALATLPVAALAQDAPAPVATAGPADISVESSAFTLATDQSRAPEQVAVRFDKADLSIQVIPADKAIDAVAVLDFMAQSPVEALVVELDTRFAVSSVQVDGQEIAPGTWTNPEGRMTVPLGRTLQTGQTASLRIAYAGQPRVAPRAPWDGGFVWSTTPDGQPWIATAVQGEGCDLFWPCIDHPLAEPGRVDLHITVPSDLAAPSNGRFVGKTDNGDGTTTWNWSAAHPNTYAIALNIGPYDEMTTDYVSRFGNVIPLTYWYLRGDDPAKVKALFDQFAPMVDFFEATVGPYPFGDEKMGVVETPHLGMEHQTINAYGNGYRLDGRGDDPAKVKALFDQFAPMVDFFEATVGPYPFGDEKMGVVETPHLGMEHQTINAYGNGYRLDGRGFDWLLHHELSHEWFGNQLTNRNADDMWLHEGLGSYMQPLYDRWLNGERFMQASLLQQRRDLINRYPVVSGTDRAVAEVYEGDTGPGLDLYNKGSLISHSLRMLVGDEAFFRAVTRLVYGTATPRPGQFQPRYGTTREFLALINEETGQDLGWFFDGYLYQAALPDLRQSRDERGLALEWVTGDGKPFPMPVEVEIDGRRSTVAMPGGRGFVETRAGSHILIDPDSKVLRRLDFIEAWKASGGSA